MNVSFCANITFRFADYTWLWSLRSCSCRYFGLFKQFTV
nr:MAG TPA: hypothetical protein [Caudoviricetes sp.]